jgi:glucose-1-phosphate thymidylyltransferase
MQALILAGGYGTRLGELTLNTPKPLLPVAGRTILDRIAERVAAVPSVRQLTIVTNARFAAAFETWRDGAAFRFPVRVVNDGTTSNENRLGAMGDVQCAIDDARLASDDLLILGGDNLFTFDLNDFLGGFERRGASLVLYDVGSLELARLYGVVELDASDRVIAFQEKPARPRSTLISTCVYAFRREHVPLIRRYLDEGNDPDKTGSYVEWVHRRIPLFGWKTSADWIDIGSPQELERANRALAGR